MKKVFRFILKVENDIETYLNIIGVGLIVVLMAMICIDVSSRILTGGSVRGLYELAEVILVFAVFFAVPWTQKQKGHVVVDVGLKLLPKRLRNYLEIAALIFYFGISSLLFYAGVLEAIHATVERQTTGGVIPWPTWPAYIGLAASFFFLTVRIAIQLMQKLRGEPIPVGFPD